MPLKKYVRRPTELQAIQWNTDEDRLEIIDIFNHKGWLYEYHEVEVFTPEHIHAGNLTQQIIMVRGNYLVINDLGMFTSEEEEFQTKCMAEADFDAMIRRRGRTNWRNSSPEPPAEYGDI